MILRAFALLLMLSAHAQDVTILGEPPAEEDKSEVVAPPEPVETNTQPALEAVDDTTVDELAKVREQKAKVIGQIEKPLINSDLVDIQNALAKGKNVMELVNDPKFREKLIRVYADNPMAKLPRAQVKEIMQERLLKSQMGGLFRTFPKLLEFFVSYMHHPTAMSQSIKIFNRPGDLKKCGFVSIFLMIATFILRRQLIRGKMPWFERLKRQALCSGIFLFGSLGFFWMNFHEEVGPMWGIFKATFF